MKDLKKETSASPPRRLRIDLDRPDRLTAAREAGQKTVAVLGVRVPESVFMACDAVPAYVGSYAASPTGGDLPRDACAVCRTSLDLVAGRWIPQGLIDAVAIAGACDWTIRLAGRLRDRVPVWTLDVDRNEGAEIGRARAVRSRAANLASVLDELGNLTDLPFTAKAFLKAYEQEMELDALCRRLDRLRATSPGAIPAAEYYRFIAARGLVTDDNWRTTARAALDAQADVHPATTGNPNVILAGSPTGFPESALVDMIEECDLRIVGDDFGLHGGLARSRPPLRGGKRAIVRWLVDELAIGRPPGENEAAGAVAQLLAERHADGIIWLTYHGCAPSAMEATRLSRWNIPVLTVEVEKVTPAPENLRTRLEAFRDQLTTKREAKVS